MRWIEVDRRDVTRAAEAHYSTEARKLRGLAKQARLRYLQGKHK